MVRKGWILINNHDSLTKDIPTKWFKTLQPSFQRQMIELKRVLAFCGPFSHKAIVVNMWRVQLHQKLVVVICTTCDENIPKTFIHWFCEKDANGLGVWATTTNHL